MAIQQTTVRFQVLVVNGYADFKFNRSMTFRHHYDVIVSCEQK
jgi:hypothetical protein